MIRTLLLLTLAGTHGPRPVASPATVTVATARGVEAVPVRVDRGIPALAAARLALLLPLRLETSGSWAVVTLGGRPFRFLLEAPLFVDGDQTIPLVGGAYLSADSLFLPLQWLADYVPRVFHEAYHYDPLASRFEEVSLAPVVRAPPPPPPAASPRVADPSLPVGSPLRAVHTVVVDPGHGGSDPGNPGLGFPKGVHEKDVTLAISKVLKEELERRGVQVLLTRSTDVLIDLRERARLCTKTCDLFVSVHVNSVPRRAGYQQVDGFETYFLDEARTAEAQRVAAMENDALRYDTGNDVGRSDQFSFILKDLQTNEYLRESAALAEAVQGSGARAHPGADRGVSQARFVVLSTARRPAILVETGFSTNLTDAKFLASPAGQRKLAQAIAEGIVEYLAAYERKIDPSTPQ